MRISLLSASLAASCLCAAAALAQDTRNVVEPRYPAACATLEADVAAPRGVIAAQNESKLSTDRIQHAMDTCPAGKAVVLRAAGSRNVLITGPLQLRPGVTLIVDANTALVASRDPRLYDLTPGSCGVVNEKGHGCKPLITGDGAHDAGVMGEGSIDGRGGAKLLGQDKTWWDLAHEAKVNDLSQSVPILIVLRKADNFTMYKITLRNSPNFHVAVNQTDGFTAWGVTIMTPRTARNTDAIDPSSSRNVTIENSYISTGDDDVAVKSGTAGPAENISILHNHFYSGHGMSIGSGTNGGVRHMLVEDLSIDGADNGLRIKSDRSRGGLVNDIVYRDVCIRNTTNPLFFSPLYTTFGGDLLPVYRDISLENVHVTTPGSNTLLGLDASHKLELDFDNVFLDDQKSSAFLVKNAAFTITKNAGNLNPSGDDVTLSKPANLSAGTPLDCSARFVPFPALPKAPEMAATAPAEDKTLYVAADGTGDFYSIQRALDAAPKQGGAVVLVAPGTYREVLTIDKPGIQLRSANADASKTIVVNDRNAGENGGTLHSATVNVTADNFLAENITFENDFNRTHPQLPVGSQALALLVTGDRAIFHNVRLLGNQDTVYAGSRNCSPDGDACIAARQYFSDCYIAGNVDYIFGDGKTAFENCELHSTAHAGGYITAQAKHYAGEDSGFVFDHCRITVDPGVTDSIFLGRPWRAYASVVFMNTEMDARIGPAGWREWHPGETHYIETVFYAESNSTGPGAHHDQRDPHTRFLTPEQVKQYAPEVFLRGSDRWNPITSEKAAEELK